LGIGKNSAAYPMLVDQPKTNPSSYILSRESQGRLRSEKPQKRDTPCELIDDLITSYSSMFRDPIQPHRMLGRDIVQSVLALLDQYRRCSDGLKGFQNRLTIRADTYVFLWVNGVTFTTASPTIIFAAFYRCSVVYVVCSVIKDENTTEHCGLPQCDTEHYRTLQVDTM